MDESSVFRARPAPDRYPVEAGLWYRIHYAANGWLTDGTARSVPGAGIGQDERETDHVDDPYAVTRSGYSCFADPRVLREYAHVQGWAAHMAAHPDGHVVAAFHGDCEQHGLDGEPLVHPDGPPEFCVPWDEFDRRVADGATARMDPDERFDLDPDDWGVSTYGMEEVRTPTQEAVVLGPWREGLCDPPAEQVAADAEALAAATCGGAQETLFGPDGHGPTGTADGPSA